MSKRKICVVITARPSYSRVKSLLSSIQQHSELELQLVLSGSSLLTRFGHTDQIIIKDGFSVFEKVYTVIEGDSPENMAKSTGLAIIELSTLFSRIKPDVVVTIADRFETLATSIAASYQNIPLAHIQGGEVTGNIDEKVRHANTKMADMHFVTSDDAYDRVLKLGEDPNFVFKTGCPSIDLAREVLDNPKIDFDPIKKYGGVGGAIDWEKGYLVVMQHPVTSEFEKAREQIQETLEAVYELGIPTFWFWPNPDAGTDGISKGIRVFRENKKDSNMHFFHNMEPLDFLRIIKNSRCLVGNSSVGIRESAFLGVPVVNIGSRQNGRLRSSNVIDCDYNKEKIIAGILDRTNCSKLESSFLYGDGMSGVKTAEILTRIKLKSEKKICY